MISLWNQTFSPVKLKYYILSSAWNRVLVCQIVSLNYYLIPYRLRNCGLNGGETMVNKYKLLIQR